MTLPTEAQLRVLSAINVLSVAAGYPPTVREIQAEVGRASSNGIQQLIQKLEQIGAITTAGGKARTIIVTAFGQLCLESAGAVGE